jgi:hypothetical protein
VLQRFFFLILRMTLSNFMSHGTQDQYPTFLEEQHHASSNLAVLIAVIYKVGALLGGSASALSESIGRRKAVLLTTLLALGAFIMQFLVQGAWGDHPGPPERAVARRDPRLLPRVTYQLGNLVAAINLPLQTRLANHFEKNFGLGMAIVIVPVLLLTALATWLGPENQGRHPRQGHRPRGARTRPPAADHADHCGVGRDRAGLVAVALPALAGVAPADIADDDEPTGGSGRSGTGCWPRGPPRGERDPAYPLTDPAVRPRTK